jgi:acetyl-CoA carboxylase carboxyltransferase component
MGSKPLREKLAALDKMSHRLRQGGSLARIERHRAKGKLTARERIEKLLDTNTFQELDLWGTPMATGTLTD